MTEQPDMGNLTRTDLDRAHESLYFAARRYCVVTEQGFLQEARICPEREPSDVSYGNVAEDLVEAGERYSEAYARWEACLSPQPEED